MNSDIFQKIENSNKPDFSEILSKSFDLFKRIWETALYHALILMGVIIPFLFIVYIPMFALIGYADRYDSYGYYNSYEPPVLLLIVYFVVVFLMIFIIQGISLGIIAHFFRAIKKEDLGTNEDIGGYFVYLKGKNLTKVMVISVATFIISIIAVMLCYFPVFYVMVPLTILQVIFAFNEELSVSDLIKASFKLGNKYWLIAFGLIILSQMIAQIGILLCFVGVFLTAFFVHLPMYYFYKDTVGFDEEVNENDPQLFE